MHGATFKPLLLGAAQAEKNSCAEANVQKVEGAAILRIEVS